MSHYRIDLHQHAMAPKYLEAFNAADARLYGADLPPWSVDGAIAAMDSHTIAAGVVSTPNVTFAEGREAADLARAVNEFEAELVKDRPDRFGVFATVPLPDVAASIAELEYAFDTLHVDGVVLQGNNRGVYLGDPQLDEVMAELNRRSAVVFVHPAPLPGPPVPGPAPALVDFLLDTTRAAVNLVVRGVTRRYPSLRFVLSHAGGFVPYAAWRIAELRADFVDLPDDHDAESASPREPDDVRAALADFYFDTALSASPTALPSLLNFAGADHVVFGSDLPYARPAVLDTFVTNQDQLLTDDVIRRAVDHGTAEKLVPRLARQR